MADLFLGQPFGDNRVFGNQTVGFVTTTPGERDRHGNRPLMPSTVPVPFCRFRQLNGVEEVTDTDVSMEYWRCTAPPVATALAAKVTGQLSYAGKTYQITRVNPVEDERGVPWKVTVDCERSIS